MHTVGARHWFNGISSTLGFLRYYSTASLLSLPVLSRHTTSLSLFQKIIAFTRTNCIPAPCKRSKQVEVFFIWTKEISRYIPHSSQIQFPMMYFRLSSFSPWRCESTGIASSGYEGVIRLHHPVADMRPRNRSSQNADTDSHRDTNPFTHIDAPSHRPSL